MTRKPETVTEPLSVLLNRLPPAAAGRSGVQRAVGGGRPQYQPYWGRDNRWDILPDRMTELPAGLRPRKQGVNWMRGMSVAAALMLLWAASMTVSFIANRELVAIAQEQVRQASAEKQSLTPACMRSPRYRKRFSTGIPLAARRRVPPRWPQSER
ncbi:hypothetical protein J4734_20370 [Klebsiella pneumoniae]|uniref:Uncharacterized protein n=1 Tax=Klebsiella pneumoniae TaxID=573 RepID=A0A939SUN5_KLEPN|nr:hypothetical protein [Klebsiella pneumoniae]